MTPYEIGLHLTAKNDIGAVLTAIAGQMLGLNKSTEKLVENFGKLKVALGGAATAFVGVEMLKFADHAERAGEALVHAKTMFEAALPAATRHADIAKVTAAAWKEAGSNMRTSIVGNIEGLHDLYNITGSIENAKHLLPSFNILKNMLDSVSDTASIGDAASGKNVANVVRAFERMGLADPAHPELMTKAMQDYVRTLIGTRGRVTGGEFFNQVQTAGDAAYGLSETFKTMGLPALMLLGGRRVGFGAYQMFNNLWGGGGGNLSSKMQALGQEKWGLHTPADEISAGGIFKGFRAGSVFEADKLRENPLEWANDYRQKLKRMGVDIENMQSVQLVIADIARNNKNLKSMFDELLLPAPNRQLNKEMANIQKVGLDAAGVVNENDPRAWRDKLSKQWKNMEEVFGEKLVDPFINNVLKPLTEMFKNMSQWGAANSGTLKIIAEGVAALGAALVGVGSVVLLTSVFGAGGLLAVAVIGIGALAALNWEPLNKYIHDFSDGIRNLGTGAFESVVGWIKSFGNAIAELWGKLQSLNPFHHTSFEGGGFGAGGGGVSSAWFAGGGKEAGLQPAFRSNLDALIAEANASGHPLGVTEGYRSYAAQVAAYRNKPGLAAIPGHSMHGRGLAADLHGDLAWAHAHAAAHGLRFPMWPGRPGGKQEPWHIEPFGKREQPAVIHNTMYLDGEVVHRSVVKRIVKGMTHPTTAPYHDTRRSWVPPDSSLVGV